MVAGDPGVAVGKIDLGRRAAEDLGRHRIEATAQAPHGVEHRVTRHERAAGRDGRARVRHRRGVGGQTSTASGAIPSACAAMVCTAVKSPWPSRSADANHRRAVRLENHDRRRPIQPLTAVMEVAAVENRADARSPDGVGIAR